MMKNDSYLLSLVDYLNTVLSQNPTTPHLNKFGTLWNWDDAGNSSKINRDLNGLTVEDICLICDAKFAEGANCQAFVLSDGVVKWYTGRGIHEDADSNSDLRVYRNAVSEGYEHNFARTDVFGLVTIQERIVTMKSVQDTLNRDHYVHACTEVNDIGRALNIGDLHSENWGFRPDDDAFVTPVIFDYSSGRNSYDEQACYSSHDPSDMSDCTPFSDDE